MTCAIDVPPVRNCAAMASPSGSGIEVGFSWASSHGSMPALARSVRSEGRAPHVTRRSRCAFAWAAVRAPAAPKTVEACTALLAAAENAPTTIGGAVVVGDGVEVG